MNIEKIKNENWSLDIDLNGGRIKELKCGDEVILGTFLRIDEKQGNTHICCPNFGSEGMEKFNLPFHGPFRNVSWNLVEKKENMIEIETIDLNLKVRQIFELGNGLNQRVVVENLGGEERIVNVAIHNYWATENGWQGIKLNGEVVDELVKSDVSRKILNENVLEISGKFLKRWNLVGFKYSQFWTGFREEDGKKVYDQKYVCVEPALEEQGFLESGSNNLLVGGVIEVEQRISLLE